MKPIKVTWEHWWKWQPRVGRERDAYGRNDRVTLTTWYLLFLRIRRTEEKLPSFEV